MTIARSAGRMAWRGTRLRPRVHPLDGDALRADLIMETGEAAEAREHP